MRYAALDSRLSYSRILHSWGLTRREASCHRGLCLSRRQKLQKLVDADPTCLDVEWEREFGEYFWPIDEPWMRSPDQKHGWKSSLCAIIAYRLNCMIQRDGLLLIIEVVECPQPAGRYFAPTDFIRAWNRSRGFCGHGCGRHIYLGLDADDAPHEQICDIIDCKGMKSHAACVQRLNNRRIHLFENCADVLVCHSCNAAVHAEKRHCSAEDSSESECSVCSE